MPNGFFGVSMMFDIDNDGPYFIAEFNTSHFGDIDLAKKMISEAARSGANCVKFQSWTAKSLYSKTYYDKNVIAKRFVKKYSLSEGQLENLAIYCRKIGIDFLSTPYSEEEARFLLQNCKARAIKIASMDINNLQYLATVASMDTNIFLSTGMATLEEIRTAVEIISKNGSSNLCLFHCVSQYPTNVEDAQILNIKMLQNEFPDIEIGYSDHTLDYHAAMAAVVFGATVVERHFTLDKTKIGMDNNMASEPDEFKSLVKSCQSIKASLGSYNRILTDADYRQRENMRRSVTYSMDLKRGHKITSDDVVFKRPGTGIAPTEVHNVLGKTLVVDVEGDTLVRKADWENG